MRGGDRKWRYGRVGGCGCGAGAALVGVAAAKSLALAWDVPFIGVNHHEAHLYSAFLEDPALEFPLVVLLVSGGHTMLIEMRGHGQYRLLGRTIDDAAGEAFDKVARFLGLGYPGGPAIDREATMGDPEAIAFPRAMLHDGLDFSFSGLKTSVRYFLEKNPDLPKSPQGMADLCASVRQAIVGVLLRKTEHAVEASGLKRVALSGGVAANRALRKGMTDLCLAKGWELHLPAPELATDNAAMMAFAAMHHLAAGKADAVSHEISPQWQVGKPKEG